MRPHVRRADAPTHRGPEAGQHQERFGLIGYLAYCYPVYQLACNPSTGAVRRQKKG